MLICCHGAKKEKKESGRVRACVCLYSTEGVGKRIIRLRGYCLPLLEVRNVF